MFVAGKYKASPTAAPDGSDVQLAVDEYGKLRISATDLDVSGIGDTTDSSVSDPAASATLVSATKGTNELLAETNDLLAAGWSVKVIEANGTEAAIVNGPGTFFGVMLGTAGASSNTLDVYDSLTGSGTKLMPTINTVSLPLGMHAMQARFSVGLSAVLATGTAAKLVLFYRAD